MGSRRESRLGSSGVLSETICGLASLLSSKTDAQWHALADPRPNNRTMSFSTRDCGWLGQEVIQ
jgi:hypothetical protein